MQAASITSLEQQLHARLSKALQSPHELASWPSVEWPWGPGFHSAVSLGSFCHTAEWLRKLRYRAASGPFDWIFSNPGMVAHALRDDFQVFLDSSHYVPLERASADGTRHNRCDHRFYAERYGVFSMFNHHAPDQPKDHAFFCRAVERFRTGLRAPERQLYLCCRQQVVHRPQEIEDLHAALRERRADACLLVLYFTKQDEQASDAWPRVRVLPAPQGCMVLEIAVHQPSNGLHFPHAHDRTMIEAVLTSLHINLHPMPSERLASPMTEQLEQQLNARLRQASTATDAPLPPVAWPLGGGFEAAVSLGSVRHTARTLDLLGFRHAAGPFDGVVSSARMAAHALRDRFTTLLDPSEVNPKATLHPGTREAMYEHRSYRARFGVSHVFLGSSTRQPETHAALKRHVQRLEDQLERQARLLFVKCSYGSSWQAAPYQELREALVERAPASATLVIHFVPATADTTTDHRIKVHAASEGFVALDLAVHRPPDNDRFIDPRDTQALNTLLNSLDVARAPAPADASEFDEAWYLRRHPDVARAVAEGRMPSGWHHFSGFGRQEGRLTRRLRRPPTMPEVPPGHVPVSADLHRHANWRRFRDFRFAANDWVAPLVLQEVPRAVLSLPLGLQRHQGQLRLVALLGVEGGTNLMVSPEGRWLAGYVPAAYRGFPFAMGPAPEGQVALFIHESQGLTQADEPGEPLFEEDRSPSKSVQDVASFLSQTLGQMPATLTACEALERAGVLEPWVLQVPGESQPRPIPNLFRIHEAALNLVSPQTLADLRRAGALPMAYAQLFSMSHLPGLLMLHRKRQESMVATLPTDAAGDLNLDFLSQDGTLKLGGLF